MSSMTKYLKQRAVISHKITDSANKPVLDIYGQPSYDAGVRVKCRKEPYTATRTTGYGQFVNFAYTYYFDDSVKVAVGDKIDGEIVQSVSEYANGFGRLVGYEVRV